MDATKRINDLNELRGAKLKEAEALREKREKDNRQFTPEERTQLKGLHTELENISDDLTLEARQLAELQKQGPRSTQSAGEKRDIDSFDLGKVLRHMKAAQSGRASVLDGVESELVTEGEREARQAGIDVTGIVLPRMLVRKQGTERRDMTAGTNNQGGYTVATEPVGLADAFYNGTVLRAGGAMVLEDLRGNIDLPRFIAGTAPTKKAENAAADETSPTLGVLSLSPKRLPAFIDLSDQLLRQSNVAIEAIVRSNLASQMLAIQEVAFFHGGGTSEANGIAGTSGIGSVAGGTNGLAPTWAHIINLESAVANVNAAIGTLNYITNTKVRGKLKQTPKVASTDSRMLWENGELNGYAPLISNAVSSALTKGTSSEVASAIFYGNVSDYVIGYWGGIQLELIRDSANAKVGQHTLVANAYYDGGVLRPASFAAMLDALTA